MSTRLEQFIDRRKHLRDFSDLRDIPLDDPEAKDAGFLDILNDPQIANALLAMQILGYIRMVAAVLRGASPFGLAISIVLEIAVLISPYIIGNFMRVEQWVIKSCMNATYKGRIELASQRLQDSRIAMMNLVDYYKDKLPPDSPCPPRLVDAYNRVLQYADQLAERFADLGRKYKRYGYYVYYLLNTQQINSFEYGMMVKHELTTLAELRNWQENSPREYDWMGVNLGYRFTDTRNGVLTERTTGMYRRGEITEAEHRLMFYSNLNTIEELREFQRLMLVEEGKITRKELEIMRKNNFYLLEQLFWYLGKETNIDRRLRIEEDQLLADYLQTNFGAGHDRNSFRLSLAQQFLDNGTITEAQFQVLTHQIMATPQIPVRQLVNALLQNNSIRKQLYKDGKITKEQLKFMTELGIYTLRELQLYKEPPFNSNREFQKFQRRQLLEQGLITKEQYEFMITWGLTNRNDIEEMKEIVAEIEKEDRMIEAENSRDDLLKKGKITKDEHKIMVAQNFSTIEELRALQEKKRQIEEDNNLKKYNRQQQRNQLFEKGYITQDGLDFMNLHDMTTMDEIKRAIDSGWVDTNVITGHWEDTGYEPEVVEGPRIYVGLPQIPGLYDKDDEVKFYPAPKYQEIDVYKRFFKNPNESNIDKYKYMLKFNDPISIMPLYEKVKEIVENPESYVAKKVPESVNYPQEPPFSYEVNVTKKSKQTQKN